MRAGRIDPADGTKLAYVLDMIRKAYETGVIEARVEAGLGRSPDTEIQITRRIVDV